MLTAQGSAKGGGAPDVDRQVMRMLSTDLVKTQLRNILVVGFPSLFQAASVFLRGIILARLLPVQQFGLGVIIISVTSALEIFADAGIDRFVVQHRFGYRADIMRTSHSYRVFGSGVLAVSIALLSYPIAVIFKAPQIWPAIALTGGVVATRGLTNLSFKLQQRDHRFEMETYIDLSRVAADLVTTTIVALIFHSYWAALAGAYANALGHLIISHLRPNAMPYSFWPRRRLIKLVARFSVPIYINATMLFAAMQGDRLVVAAMFSKPQLALYAVACMIGQGVAGLIGKIAERLLLPLMISRNETKARRRQIVNGVGAIMIGGSFLFLIGISILSPIVTHAVYGPAYPGVRSITAAAALFQMIQIQQAWLNSVLMANGVTTAFPKITMMRAASFPLAVAFVSLGMALVSIPLAFALGATSSLAMAFYAARRLDLIDRRIVIATFAGIAAAIVLVAWLSVTGRI